MKPLPKLHFDGNPLNPSQPQGPPSAPPTPRPRRGRPRKGPESKPKPKNITPLQNKLRTMITGLRRPTSYNINSRATPSTSTSTATPTKLRPANELKLHISSSSDSDSTDSSDEPPSPRLRPRSKSTPRKKNGPGQGSVATPAKLKAATPLANKNKKPSNRGTIVMPTGPPRFADHYLYSIASFHMLEEQATPHPKRGPEFNTLIGNPLVNFIPESDRLNLYPQIIRSAWNETFMNVVRARLLTPICVITSALDLTFFSLSYSPEMKPKDLIFWKCDNYMLLKILQELGATQTVVRSAAFVECDLGELEDAGAILGWWLNLGSLRGLSFSNCTMKEQMNDDFFQELFPSGSQTGVGIERLEIETNCGNTSLSQLFFYVPSVVSLSQRYCCVCQQTLDEDHVHYYPLNLSRLIQYAGDPGPASNHWEELEWVSQIPKDEMLYTFQTLSAPGNILETLSLSLKHFNPDTDLRMYRKFFKSARNLRSLELKGPLSSTTCNGDEVFRVLCLLSPIRNTLRHLSILDIRTDVPSTKKLLLCGAFAQFEYLESLYISNCEFYDINESLKEFVYSRPSPREIDLATRKFGPQFSAFLTRLEVRGIKEVDWSMVGRIADNFPRLEKLDISGINTRVVPKGPRDTYRVGTNFMEFEDRACLRHPVQLIFLKCLLLQELCMDDLDIWDEHLWAGLDLGVSMCWLKGESAKTGYPTLADLKYLEKLSLSRTHVSNITARCVKFIPEIKFLNVSFTHVNAIGINTARSDNPLLAVIAEGCNFPGYMLSEFRTPSLGYNMDDSQPEDLSTVNRATNNTTDDLTTPLEKVQNANQNWRKAHKLEIQKQVEIQKRVDLHKESQKKLKGKKLECGENSNSPRKGTRVVLRARRSMLGTPNTGWTFRDFYNSL